MAVEAPKGKSLVAETTKGAVLGGALLSALAIGLSIFLALPTAIAGPLGWGVLGGALFGIINWAR